MADTVEAVAETATTDNQPVESAEPASGLPSDVEAREADSQQQELPDGWKSVDEMAAFIKEMKDKYANLSREVKNKEKATEADIEAVQAEAHKEQLQKDTINTIVPEFVNNGMNLTEDMISRLEETGITRDQIELGAYKYKEARQRNASYVGGEENFVSIMEYTKTAMNEQEHQSLAAIVEEFTQKGLSTQPLMLGLKAMYEQGMKSAGNVDRIRGEASVGGVKPYESKQELFRDRAYIQGAGRNDSGAISKYRQRLAVTPDTVWRG